MPTYVYQCDDCGHDFEAFQKFSEDPLTVCSACGGHVRRVLQPAPVIFKGSGWYITDSRKGGGESSSGSTSSASTGGETKSESTAAATDSKPAEKAAATTD